MNVFTLEVIRTYEEETGVGLIVEYEERLLAGVFPSRQDAMFCWKESMKGEWEDFDITEWEV